MNSMLFLFFLKNSIVILILVSLNVNIALGSMNILTIIILLTLEYRIIFNFFTVL